MSDEVAFRTQVRANPTDHITRLVFADWLQEENRHIDAALMRVCAVPGEDAYRLQFARACEDEADLLVAGKFLVTPETPLGKRHEWLRHRGELVRVQCELERGPEGIDCHTVNCVGLNSYECFVTPESYKEVPVLVGDVCARVRETHGGRWDVFRGKIVRRHSTVATHKGICFRIDDAEAFSWGDKLRVRENQLLDAVGYHVVNTPNRWHTSMTVPASRVRIRRGFVDSWDLTAEDWFEHADDIRELHPLTTVTFTTPVNYQERSSFDRNAPPVPPGWRSGYRIRKKWWTWQSLGEPDFSPDDRNALVRRLVEAEFPGITFGASQLGVTGVAASDDGNFMISLEAHPPSV